MSYRGLYLGTFTEPHRLADLKEEFSAFHARTVREQAVFIQHCIKGILQEYTHLPQEKRPTQVTLLAHSMGGVVARLAMDPIDRKSVV